VIEETAKLLPVVLFFETVGDYLGIDRTTWRGWLRRGRREVNRLAKEGGEPRESESLYVEFFYTYKRAIAQGDKEDLAAIKAAGMAGAWQACAWRQERRHPEKWSLERKRLAELEKDVQKMAAELAAWRVGAVGGIAALAANQALENGIGKQLPPPEST
jgi:hypothetical protein